MKKFLLSTGFLLSFFIGFGQCPNGDILFTSQAEINAFAIDFPDCTVISFPNNVTISGDDIVDLTPLSQIVSIENDLVIDNNPQLVSVAGLDNLTDFTGANLIISNNPMLSSLNGIGAFGTLSIQIINNDALLNLNGLEQVVENFQVRIEDNDALQNLSGLDNYSLGIENTIKNNANLSSLEGLESLIGVENIIIEDNPLLTDISSLENLEEITVLFEIRNNDSLTNLEGLQGVGATFNFAAGFTISDNELLEDISAVSDFETPSSFIEITNNPSLSDCRIALLCNNIENTDLITIENNAPGCDSVVEVSIDCSFCSSGDVILTTQAEVDEFGSITFGCDIIEGTLRISGVDIVDLSPLSSIQIVGGFEIIDNRSLESLDGLDLFSIGSTLPGTEVNFIISDNDLLENIDGLSGVFEVFAETFEISNNQSLVDISALSGAFITTDDVAIINNDSLINLEGLNELPDTDELFIEGNDALQNLIGLDTYNSGFSFTVRNNVNLSSLDGLNNFNSIIVLSIQDNPLLTDMSILQNLNEIAENFEIRNNDALTNLNGLQSGNVFLGFTVTDNDALVDISALSNVSVPSSFIEITNNSNLSDCAIDLLCDNISNTDLLTIASNAPNCNSVEEVEEQCSLSVSEAFLGNTIKLYPNPTIDTSYISFPSGIQLQKIDVFSITGRNMFTTQEPPIDFSSLTRGVYFARIQTNQGTVIKKIVKK